LKITSLDKLFNNNKANTNKNKGRIRYKKLFDSFKFELRLILLNS